MRLTPSMGPTVSVLTGFDWPYEQIKLSGGLWRRGGKRLPYDFLLQYMFTPNCNNVVLEK